MRHFAIPDYEYPVLPLFSPCGRWLHGTGGHGLVTWDLAGTSSQPIWENYELGGVMRFTVSPCGRYIAGAEDRCVVVWDMTTRGEAKWIRANQSGDHISDVAFTPNGTDLLTVCIDGRGGVRRWRVGNWRRKPAFGIRAYIDGALAVSPDGKTLATVYNHAGKQPGIRLWRYPNGKPRLTAPCDGESFVRLAYSPDGSVIVANDNRCCVRVWDARTLVPVGEYTPRLKTRRKVTYAVRSFAFHPSGRYLAVTGDAGPVEFLDTVTWQPVRVFDWKIGRTFGVAFSPDGMLAAAGGDKGMLVVWDVDV